jgi:ABC-type glycerol-3-phosphate transport system substrate-binding protein
MKSGMSMFQIVLLCAFGGFAIAGILIFAFLIGSNSSGSLGEVIVWGTFDDTAVATVVRQLSENDDRLRSIQYVEKNPDTFEQELTNALAAGTGPDLYIIRNDYAVLDTPKLSIIPIEQLSREQFDSLFIEAARPFLHPEGTLAVPLAVDPLVLYWNRDLFANAGLARPPLYWDELQQIARAISRKSDAGSLTKSAISFGEYGNVTHAKNIIGTLILQAGGPVTARDSAGTLQPALQARTTGNVAAPAQSALSFYTGFANPSQDIYSWNRSQKESIEAFTSGDLGLFVGLASEEPFIRRQNPNLNFGIAPLPQIRDAERSMTGGYAYGFAVPRASKNPSGALTGAYLLASPEASAALTTAFGISSARRDVLALPAQGNDDLFNKMAIITRLWEDPNPQETDRIFRDMIESITSGAAKLSEALQRADASMREIQTQ